MKVAIYACEGPDHKRTVAEAMAAGFRRHRIKPVTRARFTGVEADIAVAYGWIHRDIFRAYRDKGRHFVYFDLGYWGRDYRRRPDQSYYRCGVDDWDTAAKMRRACPPDRFDRLGIAPKPARLSGHRVLVTGMSGKAAWTHGFKPGEWEGRTMAALCAMDLDFPIVLRTKEEAKERRSATIQEALKATRVLVTHHSNTAVDALVEGIPFYAEKGVGAFLSPKRLTAEFISAPRFVDDDDRRQLLNDIAYAQWTPAEMRSGEAWAHIGSLI